MRDPHCDREFLLHQQDRNAAPGNFGDQIADLLDYNWRQALGRLVDHDEFGVTHQRAANCQHLLLAARHHAGGRVGARGKVGEHLQHVLQPPLAWLTRVLDAKRQILSHGEPGEDVAMLGHIAEPEMRDLVTRQPGDVAALEQNGSLRRHLAHDRLDRRGTADAVAAEQAHNLAGIDMHIDALQDVALAVEGVQILDFQHHAASSPR